jgi:hypothetical protein
MAALNSLWQICRTSGARIVLLVAMAVLIFPRGKAANVPVMQ